MAELKMTQKLTGDFGELMFEHFSQTRGFAYISTEEVYRSLTPNNILLFRFGYQRISVKIPEEVVDEVRRLCKPSNEDEEGPTFTIDYLTVCLTEKCFENQNGKWRQIKPLDNIERLNWCEIKSKSGQLSENQKKLVGNTKIPFSVFRINFELLPNSIDVLIEDKYHRVAKDSF